MIFREEETEEEKEGQDDNKLPTEEREMEVSINSTSMVGYDSPKIMKLIGHLKGRDVVVLLDSGATHNFISDKVVNAPKIYVNFV